MAGNGSAGSGFISWEELKEAGLLPTQARFAKGPVVVIECTQEIPCNPCEEACKFGAIKVGKPITNIPSIDLEACTGCGLCISKCPGLAIFVVDKTYSQEEATVAFPFEYLPLPVKDTLVEAVNREGETVCKGKVLKVLLPQSFDRTPVVTVAVPQAFADEVRGIKRLQRGKEDGQR